MFDRVMEPVCYLGQAFSLATRFCRPSSRLCESTRAVVGALLVLSLPAACHFLFYPSHSPTIFPAPFVTAEIEVFTVAEAR